MTLLLYILYFAAGLGLLVKGADWLTDGAAAIAKRLGVPTIVVGLTIVAIGSSLPEFVVSVVSAAKGNTDMAVGNIVGSNIFNVLVIIGLTAAIRPIAVNWSSIRNDVPFVMLSSAVVLITCWNGVVERTEGLLMLCMFAIFLSYTFSLAKADHTNGTPEAASAANDTQMPTMLRATMMCLGGLIALVVGGNGLVDGGAGAARLVGVPESIVALTFISMGTSAPELAASVMAARKGDHGMALGNVVGSAVFNVFYVLGTASVVRPLTLSGVGFVDFGVLLGASILLWIVCLFGSKEFRVSRMEGFLLLLVAAAYYGWLLVKTGLQG